MDIKGRVALPPDFRKALAGPQGERLLLTRFRYRDRPDWRCLDGWPEARWAEVEQRIVAKARDGNERMQRVVDAYVAAAVLCEVDGQGRVLVPQPLRDHAGLERDVVLVGRGDQFRIWREPLWQVVYGDASEVFDDAEAMKDAGLY